MWQPEPGWERLPGGMGPSTVGVWLATRGSDQVVVKRFEAPLPEDPTELSDPHHFAYWRRASDVAVSGVVVDTPGLRAPALIEADEDDEGITLVQAHVPTADVSSLFVAHNLGRFAAADLGGDPWFATGQLRDRITRVERRGGWRTLARTTVADVAHRLWERRETLLARLAEVPEVAAHGDPVPGNLPGRAGDDTLAIDWSTLGFGPVGADAGYFALSTPEDFDAVVDAYHAGLPEGVASRADIDLAARITAVYTVLSRADWALARVADGEGALAGKYRHPSVAPYLRALQRQFPQIEALL